MDFSPNKTPIEIIKKVLLAVFILVIFILILIKNGTEIHGKNLFIYKMLMLILVHQIIMI